MPIGCHLIPSPPEFVELLNELRKGTISPSAQTTFTSLSRALPPLPSGILPTELYPLRAQVERANSTRLAALPGAPRTFAARDTGTHQKMLEQMVVPAQLVLKANSQVMLVKNVDEKLVNGSVGRVLGFYNTASCLASVAPPTPQDDGAKPKSTSASQEAGAAKAGGAVRNVQVGPDGRTPVFFYRPVEGKENAKDGKPASAAKGKAAKDEERYPLVEFRTAQGTEIVLVVRDEFRVEDNEGKLLARRVQVRNATMHSNIARNAESGRTGAARAGLGDVHPQEPGSDDPACQDRPAQRVRERCDSFPSRIRGQHSSGRATLQGQSYVALSRAASLDGLQVLGFDPKKVRLSPMREHARRHGAHATFSVGKGTS